MSNLFTDIPNELPSEIFEDILSTPNIRIERILSHGHSSPEQGWYDQDENEWVLVLSGFGVIEFDDGRVITLNEGDYLNIKAHEKHKVQATAPNETTVWLAVFYR
ncbi:cupin domain-containing protein [Aliivibrio fischeri]|uniref:cupin domain-containing protein n=1 Tax=Aliivibrio fischeri TaxID=668 RepID=UPI0012D93678|nr:cupin domain-containing protein [Aliivibrio fischeri]MUK62980.1 cupin domain-containing protein [Aliivibrio fischeri]MUK77876.1 cupin domain-containing protein [Aliivibrio fischeri]MUL20403.1 cupin domain-containing protein [Aliivibrio fischeri]MUL24178.1 cupin domain-containing protein [Aliivibrio fischeri]